MWTCSDCGHRSFSCAHVHTSTLFGFAAVLPHLGYERRRPRISLKYHITDATNFVRSLGLPWETEGRWRWRGLAACYLFLCPGKDSGPWSCPPQPLGFGGDVNPCEDPRQEHGPQFRTSVRCRFNLQEKTSGLKGAVTRTRARHSFAPQRECSRSAWLEAATRVPAKAHGAHSASTPRRATIPEPAGTVPRTGR